MTGALQNSAFEALSQLLLEYCGQRLESGRRWRMDASLLPIMREYGLPDLSTTVAVIRESDDAALRQRVIEAMINNETSFYRDQAYFALLTGPIFDALHHENRNSRRLRIWCSACSTGQEAWSIAMALAENSEKWRGWHIEIFASDVSSGVIEKARNGVFSQFEIQRGMPVTLMLKYFTQSGEDWKISDPIKKMVRFSQHNLLTGPIDSGVFDIILCRNMLMYLDNDARDKILDLIHTVMAPQGILMLGAAETILGQKCQLAPSREFRGFYKKSGSEDLLIAHNRLRA
jgi:chemotaxis protein methyltransferase CheR